MVSTFRMYSYVGKNIINFNHNPQKNNFPLNFSIYWPNFPVGIFEPNYMLITKVLNTNKYLISLSLKVGKSHLEKNTVWSFFLVFHF